MNDNSSLLQLQAQASNEHFNNLQGNIPKNQARNSMSLAPSYNFSNVIQNHKFRSPSLPVNSFGINIELPELVPITADKAHDLLETASELTLFVDIRPFTLYSKSRMRSAVSVCIPSTLLKRPTFVLARFTECMIPAQRGAIQHLDRYDSVVIYDQATKEVSSATYSPTPLVYTFLKFSRSPALKGKLYYIKGGFLSFEKEFPNAVDQLPFNTEAYGCSNSNEASNNSGKPASKHGYSNSQPTNKIPIHTFNFPPVLTGFSLPTNCIKDGPMKPFASNIRSSLDGIDIDDEVAPMRMPTDLDPVEVETCFPLWLQDIINKDTGPRNVFRRFHDIEKAEKVRLQSAFNRGTSMLSTSTHSTTSNNNNAGLSKVASYSSLISLSPTTPEGGQVKYTFSAGVELGSKNRYNNIWPYDHTRVKVPELNTSTITSGAERINGAASHDPTKRLATNSNNTTTSYDDNMKQTTNATNETNLNHSNSGNSLGKDYFNASYITTKGTKMRYIATQGPLPDTFTDFWHVVWAKRIPMIVMLTAETEGGSIKCHRYWNNGVYGGIALQLVSTENVVLSEKTGTRVIIRTFELEPAVVESSPGISGGQGINSNDSNDHRHTVIQMQYTAWPDLGSPANPEDLIALCMLKNQYVNKWVQKNPESVAENLLPWTIVHCSAGCGRTGTFCTVDSVINLLQTQAKNNPAETPFHNAAAARVATLNSRSEEKGGETTAMIKSSVNTTGSENVESYDLIYRTVHNFRRQRLSMVQVLRQYVLCYETVILWIHNQCGPAKHRQGLLPQLPDQSSGS